MLIVITLNNSAIMSIAIIILLLTALALLLFLVEAAIIPGFGIFGILATVCVIAADVLVYAEYGGGAAIAAVIVSTIVVLLFFWWLSRSKMIDRVSLRSTISSTSATAAQLSVKAGDEGVAVTRLALIGNANIGGQTVEVKSEDGFIDEGTPIIVTSVKEALILVKRKA